MKVSDIIKITHGSVLGRKDCGYVASLAGTDYPACTSKSPQTATEGLLSEIKDHLKNVHERRYFFSPSGRTVFALYHTYGGWGYDIMSPDHKSPSYCGFASNMTFRVACDLVQRHADSYDEEVGEKCLNCQGRGEFPDHQECVACHGKGTVIQKHQEEV